MRLALAGHEAGVKESEIKSLKAQIAQLRQEILQRNMVHYGRL